MPELSNRGISPTGALNSHQELQGVHLELLELAFLNELSGVLIVPLGNLVLKRFEDFQTVLEMLVAVLVGGGAHGFDIEADILALGAVVVLAEKLDLVESGTEIFHAEALVLIKLETVLVIEMYGKELVESKGEAYFIGGIESGENGVGRLEVTTDT